MKAATVREIKYELNNRPTSELVEIVLRLSKFKKENKELLTYLLYEAADEQAYIQSVQSEVDEMFDEINTNSYYYIKKSVRKILRHVKKYIRYSQNKETEADLLIYFCKKLKGMTPAIYKSQILLNIYERQVDAIRKTVSKLHEDLQYDYEYELEKL